MDGLWKTGLLSLFRSTWDQKKLLDATSYESYDMLPRVPNLLQPHILTLATSVFGEYIAMLRCNIYNHLQSALKAKARAASPANQAGISSLHMPGKSGRLPSVVGCAAQEHFHYDGTSSTDFQWASQISSNGFGWFWPLWSRSNSEFQNGTYYMLICSANIKPYWTLEC